MIIEVILQTIDNVLITVHKLHSGLLKAANYFLSYLEIIGACATLGNMQATRYRYRYNGKEQLSRFGGRYDYGFRMYDAGLARFLSVDPLTKDYPNLSAYQYAKSNPILFIDYLGLAADDPGKGKKSSIRAKAKELKNEIASGLSVIKKDLKYSFGSEGMNDVKQGMQQFGQALTNLATAKTEDDAIARDGIFMIGSIATTGGALSSLTGGASVLNSINAVLAPFDLYSSLNTGLSSFYNASNGRHYSNEHGKQNLLAPELSVQAEQTANNVSTGISIITIATSKSKFERATSSFVFALDRTKQYLTAKYPHQHNVQKTKK